MKFYRFNNGVFVKAATFEEAKKKLIAQIEAEEYNPEKWAPCTCLGFQHRYGCPEMEGVIPF